jgi:hypothetical protein
MQTSTLAITRIDSSVLQYTRAEGNLTCVGTVTITVDRIANLDLQSPETTYCAKITLHETNPHVVSIRKLRVTDKGAERLFNALALIHNTEAAGLQRRVFLSAQVCALISERETTIDSTTGWPVDECPVISRALNALSKAYQPTA